MVGNVIAWLSFIEPPFALVEYCQKTYGAVLVRPHIFEQNGGRISSARDVLRYAYAAVADYTGEQSAPCAVFIPSTDELPLYTAKILGDIAVFKVMLVKRASGFHWTGALLRVRDATV